MIKILFICNGNICRSPMAEFMMKDLVEKRGLEKEFEISSAATSNEEIGNDMYPPAKRMLKEKGIDFSRRAARQLRSGDYDYYDRIICMDEYNLRNILKFFGGDPANKVSMLLDRPVADPWYTGDFETTYNDLSEGLCRLMEDL